MGICDDGPYVLIAQKLAATGHIFYNGNTTPFLGWQVYLGAAFIKIFGFSFTSVRMSTLLVAATTAWLLQRTLVLAGINERNATVGTLALALSPLYLMLSATYMTDIFGLFAIVICLYGCLRALQAPTDRATVGWLCFAVATNALFGSARQIAWLGVLVMAPSTLWLFRSRRRVFVAGAAVTFAGALFVLGCMLWFLHQPYNVHEPLIPSTFPVRGALWRISSDLLDIPFLLLPMVTLFLPELGKARPRLIAVLLLLYLLVAVHPRHPPHQVFLLEPTTGNWLTVYGLFPPFSHGGAPLFLHLWTQILLTVVSLGGLLGVAASLLSRHRSPDALGRSSAITWKQIGLLVVPFAIAYTLLLLPRAATVGIPYYAAADRYLLGLLVVALPCLVRYYQDQIRSRLPDASIFLVAIMAIYGVAATHNMWALYRARVVMAAELRADGIPDTSVDNGWEYNFNVELQHAGHLNDERIVIPAHAYVPTPPPAGKCLMWGYGETPHIHPLYGVSFDPNACYGPAPFTPVHYSRWLASSPGTLYVVRYTPVSTH